MTKTRRVLNSLWVALIAAGLAVMVAMLIWSYPLAGDFSGRYASAEFHQHFWSIFFRGEALAFVGCLGLSVTLPFGIAIRAGLWTLGLSSAFLAFCGGAAMAVIGSLRLGWRKLSS